ncbi:calmodulin-binding protein-like protein Sha1 [Clohesyomyces aquaticus]|uniref:Calmodulin-binding protein-like protein Sha1 n=1 Tax=Clohesyomyces aquaticus TaxID=1231657 RepID=A0A1Y1ZPB2_9PLEO|nr:calmodulin-binding protein-like protein Sha1 [Clohesyomyces aquaticus]
MRRYADATPCPAPHSSSFSSNRYHEYGHRDSLCAPSYMTDDTTTMNLEYTIELKMHASLRNAKPRRPMRASRKEPFNPAMDIFEDVAQEEEQQQLQQVVEPRKKSRASILPRDAAHKQSTILAHPAQKLPIPVLTIQEATQTAKPNRRRVSQMLMDRQAADVNATVQLQEHVLERRELKKQGPKKDPRRRTIYVPSDDTTIITIHPGQPTHTSRNPRTKSPDIGFDLVTLSEEEENLVSVLKKDRKPPRKSLAAAPSKRVPLQHNTRSLQATTFSQDVLGQGGGKENVPPGMDIANGLTFGDDLKKPAPKPARVHFNTAKLSEINPHAKAKSEGSQKRLRSQVSSDKLPSKSVKAKADGTASTTARKSTLKDAIAKGRLSKAEQNQLSSSPFHTDRSPPTALRRRRPEHAPTKITMMHEVGKRPDLPREKYPVLAEDLARPELYEDHWLTYQEAAITQLLNSLFDSAGKDPNYEQCPEDLRKNMLAIYHDPSIPLLHKRLQASLLYGALSIPKDLLSQTLRLKDDVGMRKKFLNLWVKSYDLIALRAAAETIVGRQIPVSCRLSSGSTSSDDGSRQYRTERRAIEAFLDAFLIRNEDAVRVKSAVGGTIGSIARGDHMNNDDFGSQGWAWRRTILRSLMLVLLLDKAKSADILPGCLFQTSSPHKTSVDVLHVLANLLLPSLGDVTRPLGHLHYKVEHIQCPLQEYTYHIDNIAIDLRDGVILTRLVELLLYPPSSLVTRCEDTVTITMPTGDILTSTFDFAQKDSWVLSQHLKFPSLGRAQKLYNVQIALAALTGVRGIPTQAVGGVKADDIVDGHREKTLSLLWSLAGKCGLRSLVDWPQIVKEITRFRDSWYKSRDNYAQCDLDSDCDDDATADFDGNGAAGGLEYHSRLLLSWARNIARLHGLRVANFTTSFSDQRVLEAIVDTYLPPSLLPISVSASSTTSKYKLSLSAKLKATGCSTAFIALFTPTSTSTIPSKDFTLISLSFLASRLLPLSLTHRAAETIQRAYRLHLTRREMKKRVLLAKVAAECAVVAVKREKLVKAAMVVQKRWRGVRERKREDMVRGLEAFQALARGWAIRRWVRRVTGGRVGGKEKVRRARGGW